MFYGDWSNCQDAPLSKICCPNDFQVVAKFRTSTMCTESYLKGIVMENKPETSLQENNEEVCGQGHKCSCGYQDVLAK